jgi:hypothetical protein
VGRRNKVLLVVGRRNKVLLVVGHRNKVLLVVGRWNKVLLVVGWGTKFYWSWAGEQSFIGRGPGNKVLLVVEQSFMVVGRGTDAHCED